MLFLCLLKWILIFYFCRMNKYNSYHSGVKTCYALGIQDQVLPESFTKSIPRSTSNDWKELSPDKFVGSEFASQIETDLEQVKLILDERLRKIRVSFFAFCRLYLTILNFIGEKNFEKIILQNRESVIDLVNNLPVSVSKNLVCRFLRVSPHQFKIWKSNRLFRCLLSPIGYCRKRFPQQISQKEINILKSLTSRKRFETWSLASIWGYAIRNGHISMSRTSWYRYCLRLGISEERKPEKKNRKRDSIKASKPNEIWHMDVTQFVTSDNIKFYVYTVIDNFSRKVLAWNVSREISAKTRLISLKEAIRKVLKLEISDLELISDGGPENDNFRVRNLLRHSDINIQLKIAKKDIKQSNSVIEGSFKILKAFLRKKGEIHSHDFIKILEFFFKDYNNVRPHYLHEFYTPNEIYESPELANVKPELQRINNERLEANRTSCCKF